MGYYSSDKPDLVAFWVISILLNIIMQLILTFTLIPNFFGSITHYSWIIITAMIGCPICGLLGGIIYNICISDEEDFDIKLYKFILHLFFAFVGDFVFALLIGLAILIFGAYLAFIGLLAILIVPAVIFLSRY